MKHELKIWPQYFSAVLDGTKTFEVRENDRGFQKGDSVELREWDPNTDFVRGDPRLGGPMIEQVRGYTTRSATAQIGYVLPIDERRVVFSLIEVRS